MKKIESAWFLLLIMVLMVVTGGCGGGGDGTIANNPALPDDLVPPNDPVLPDDPTPPNDPVLPDNPNTGGRIPAISIESAKAIALKHAGVSKAEVTFIKAAFYDKNGVLQYDFEFKDSEYVYSCEVDANTGNVSAFYVKNIFPENLIGEEQAKKIAIAKAGGGIVTKCELEDYNNRPVYEIEVRNGKLKYEMYVDALDGSIADFRMD